MLKLVAFVLNLFSNPLFGKEKEYEKRRSSSTVLENTILVLSRTVETCWKFDQDLIGCS